MTILAQPSVLACIDGSAISPVVCDYAAWISQCVGAPLTLLHNIEQQESAVSADFSGSIGLGSQDSLLAELSHLEQQRNKLLVQQGRYILDAAQRRVQQAGITEVTALQRHGNVTESLLDLEEHIRVLVVGIRGATHPQQSHKIGAQLEMMIRALHRPILVSNSEFKIPSSMLLTYDGSAAADKAVDMVATSPLYRGMSCHLVCASQNSASAEKILAPAHAKLSQTPELHLISRPLVGKADKMLCEYQQQHDLDLMVMGAFSHTRLHEMILGSFTIKMLTQTHKPLLLLR